MYHALPGSNSTLGCLFSPVSISLFPPVLFPHTRSLFFNITFGLDELQLVLRN